MRRFRSVFGLCAVVVSVMASAALGQAVDAAALQAGLEQVRAKHKVPALGALLMDERGVVWQGVTGRRQQTSKELVTIDDRWHLGSCTKAMTATLAARLVERGLISWDTRLAEVMANLKDEMEAGWEKVTLRQLLSHTAGIAKEPIEGPVWLELRKWDESGVSTREQRVKVARWLVAQKLGSEPGTAMKYSNAGYMLAGAMLEVVADRSWEDLMQEEVFGPLGITSAGFGAPGTRGVVDQPRGGGGARGPGGVGHRGGGHRGGGGVGGIWMPISPMLTGDNPRCLGPAGTVHMTRGDWATFVRVHARLDPCGAFSERAGGGGAGEFGVPAGYLKPETVRMLHTPAPGTTPEGQPETAGYALGWGVSTRPWAKGAGAEDRGLTLNHGGSNTSWLVIAWVAPERGLVILGVCNAPGDEGARACDEAIGMLLTKSGAAK